jgi:hypothetical protein
MPAKPGSPHSPWDFFHINAVDSFAGNLLVDSRNTWAAYEVDTRSGQVIWRLGGKRSSFAMGPGASPAWQHDARDSPGGTITFFDNGGTPPVHPQSRAIVLRLDLAHMTASLVASFTHAKPLLAASQGNFQQLPDGNWLVGWGQEPYFSELSPTGQLLFDAHLPAAYQSYTVLEFPWSGAPVEGPRLAVRRSRGGGIVGYVSWNGSTAVAAWRLAAGADPRALRPVAAVPRSGFETRIAIASVPRYVQAQALDASGKVLASSAVVHP